MRGKADSYTTRSKARPMEIVRPTSTPRKTVLMADVIHTSQSSLFTCAEQAECAPIAAKGLDRSDVL